MYKNVHSLVTLTASGLGLYAFLRSFTGEFENAPLGNVNVEDPDDWDRPDKEFSFVNQQDANYFT